MVAARRQGIAQRLDGIDKHIVIDLRYHDRHQLAAPGGEAAGQRIGDIARRLHSLHHFLYRFWPDQLGRIQRPTDRHRRQPGAASDILQRRRPRRFFPFHG